jgi:hypothetical protein
MKEYILFIILGIILYFIIQDSINKFSIGIPPKRRPWLEGRTCATSYVSTEDVDSNSDDTGYDTANSSEPPTIGYLFQGYPLGTTPIYQWYFTTVPPPYGDLRDLEGNILNISNHRMYQISPAPNIGIIQTTRFFDPTTLYDGMDYTFNNILIISSSIYNLSYTE